MGNIICKRNKVILENKIEKSPYSTKIKVPEKVYWQKKIAIPNTPYSLQGYSQAARHTGFYIKELDLFLDCGVPHNQSPKYIFCTHGHYDHCSCLPQALIDTNQNPAIFVPEKMYDHFYNFINGTFVLTKNNIKPKIHNKYKLIGVKPFSDIVINVKNMKWQVEIFNCNHTVPTVGYGFIELRNKLKPEYKNHTQEQLNELHKSGIIINHQTQVPLFCFLGDTDHMVFKDDRLYKYKTIIIECTFFEKKENRVPSKKDNMSELELYAHKNKHIYWDNLYPIIKLNPETLFILTHFSARYSDAEIHEFFKSFNLSNIIVWI